MAKVITQETFNDVVKENVVEFSMTPEEAKEETIKQFEAQGISLVNIIKDLKINDETGQPILNEAIEKLQRLVSDKPINNTNLLESLETLNEECKKSVAHRVLAAKNGAYDTLTNVLEAELALEMPNDQVLKSVLEVLNNLTNKNPDVFNAKSLAIAKQLLNSKNENLLCLTLQWLQKACLMHEMNRQNIMNAGVVKILKPLIFIHNIELIRDILAVFRFLVLDDDIRVEFGCAHEHARQIATEVLFDLVKLINEFEDVNVLADLLLTVGTLAVRQEFCNSIEEAGGLTYVFKILKNNLDAVRLNREGLKLLRALSGHDSVKAHMIQQGVAPLIKDILQTHMANENIVGAALACVSTLTLRVKENSATFFETGIAEIMVEAIRLHPKSKTVQRNGAWAIRNMVSRSREQCEVWLSFGIEDLLNTAMKDHVSVQQDIKAALRDLGCKVELKEEWTGTAEKKILN